MNCYYLVHALVCNSKYKAENFFFATNFSFSKSLSLSKISQTLLKKCSQYTKNLSFKWHQIFYRSICGRYVRNWSCDCNNWAYRIIFTASRKKNTVNNRACMWALGIFNLDIVKDFFSSWEWNHICINERRHFFL